MTSTDLSASPAPHAYYSAGKWHTPQRYIVGWPDHSVVKVGYTSIGRRRYGRLLTRGGVLLDLHGSDDALEAEQRLQDALARRWPSAFSEKAAAEPLLGPQCSGWLECYRIPRAEWADVLALAGVDA